MSAVNSEFVRDKLQRHWVCEVVRSGLHNGAGCSPDDPHDDRCMYRLELSVRDNPMNRSKLGYVEEHHYRGECEYGHVWVGQLYGPSTPAEFQCPCPVGVNDRGEVDGHQMTMKGTP